MSKKSKNPYNLNLQNEIESEKINFVKNKTLDLDFNYAMSNSFGFAVQMSHL